jgi:hypothetical protein
MKKLILLTAIALFAFSYQVEAQNCNHGKKLAENMWVKWGPWRPNISLIPFGNEVNALKNAWNWISSNGIATVGPRFLEIDNGNKQGTILGQTKRTFVTPPSFNNTVEITINKYDGRAETGVIICVQGKDGITRQKANYTFQNSRNGKVRKFTLEHVKGRIIIIAMKNKSIANKFKYRIKAK